MPVEALRNTVKPTLSERFIDIVRNPLVRVGVTAAALFGVANMASAASEQTPAQRSTAAKLAAVSCSNFDISMRGGRISADANCFAAGKAIPDSQLRFSGSAISMDADNYPCETSNAVLNIVPTTNSASEKVTFNVNVPLTKTHGAFKTKKPVTKTMQLLGNSSPLACGTLNETSDIPPKNEICPVPDTETFYSSDKAMGMDPIANCGVAPPGPNTCAITSSISTRGNVVNTGHVACTGNTKICSYDDQNLGGTWFNSNLPWTARGNGHLDCGNEIAIYGISSVELIQPDSTSCKAKTDAIEAQQFVLGNWTGKAVVTAHLMNSVHSTDQHSFEIATAAIDLNKINPGGNPNGCDDFPPENSQGVRVLHTAGKPTIRIIPGVPSTG